MNLIKPMLAKAVGENFDPSKTPIQVEPKLDGHRHLIRVHADGSIQAWSRILKDGLRKMDDQMQREMREWTPGVYDGELDLGYGNSSSDVAMISRRGDLKYVAFDRLMMGGVSIMHLSWKDRRYWLEHGAKVSDRTRIIPRWECSNREQLKHLSEREWERGGEGLVVKHLHRPYHPGKRSRFFGKIKKIKSSILIITKYSPPIKDSPTDMGVVSLVDDEGNRTSVKIRNHEMRDYCLNNSNQVIGRKLSIEYQQRLPGGSYRHPRWDHLV